VQGINGGGTKKPLEELHETFKSPQYSVTCLAKSAREKQHTDNEGLKLEDRVWTWKQQDFTYCASRARQQPGYVGSYAMDATSMALHCVWTTHSFKQAMLKCANLCGDSDSVTSVCGQIAGSIYGLSGIPKTWVQAILQWDPDWNIPLRAYKLYNLSKKEGKKRKREQGEEDEEKRKEPREEGKVEEKVEKVEGKEEKNKEEGNKGDEEGKQKEEEQERNQDGKKVEVKEEVAIDVGKGEVKEVNEQAKKEEGKGEDKEVVAMDVEKDEVKPEGNEQVKKEEGKGEDKVSNG